MLYPSIDVLLDEVGSKFELCVVAATRARQLQERPERLTLYKSKAPNQIGKALEELFEETVEYTNSNNA
ncbi:MAG: DNA-directed RNA polymerase subunit omega [Culicoidibacterales bacterium]